MCGIAGKFNLNQERVTPELIKAMCDQIVHRGPDASGEYVDRFVGLGHRRLSIIDLSELGRQPMCSADKKLWITFNGEIYNFQDLREDLLKKGYQFKSSTDTEVIIYLYREYGEQCLEYLRGMFAFAIWDAEKERLFIARDRIGKKPLYYYFNGHNFIFASELKSILKNPEVKRDINFEAFYDYFKYLYVPDPKTIYKNIHKLPPAHYLVCSAKGIEIKEYWDVSFHSISTAANDEITYQLLNTLRESVQMRMISDVPLGAFLSGGIDSSAVVALMAALQQKPVTTCTIGFNSKKYDEIEYARQVAQKFGTEHHEFTVEQNVREILEKIVSHFDEPFADASAVPTYYVSQIARKQVTVALAGDGGDENFAGYEKYLVDDRENKLRNKIPLFLRKSFCPVSSRLLSQIYLSPAQRGASFFNSLSVDPAYGFYITNSEFNNGLWERIVTPETMRLIGDYDPYSITRHYYEKADTDNHLLKILYTDLKTYLPGEILVKVDRMSMANSLEVRAPILDQEVIQFAATIPADLKFMNGEKKYILKKTFDNILPDEILYRKKMGFSVPLAHWFRTELKDLTYHYLFYNNSGLQFFFNMNEIKKLWNNHQSKKHNFGIQLWILLMFELWYKKYLY